MPPDLDRAGRTPPGAQPFAASQPFAEPKGRDLPASALRHRVRRALVALRLSEGQAVAARALKGHLDEMLETRQRLDDSRRALSRELSRPAPDAARLSELLAHERHFEAGARVAWSRLQQRLGTVLTPGQVARLHALPSEVLGDTLIRLMTAFTRSRSRQPVS